MRWIITTLCVALMSHCAAPERRQPSEPAASELVADAWTAHNDRLEIAQALEDPHHQWIAFEDCDGWVWDGRYSSATGRGDMTASERPGLPGAFYRKPVRYHNESPCGDMWSQDQGVHLLLYTLKRHDVALLERHIAYGEAHAENCDKWYTCQWDMGNSATGFKYSPQLVGMFYSVRKHLTGEDHEFARWPIDDNPAVVFAYAGGLNDYRANLQMTGIHIRETVEGFVTDPMHDRILEHSTREPGNGFYWYLRGKYNGDMVPSLRACINGNYGTYVRCDVGLDAQRCILAELIFSCDLVLKYMEDRE